MTNPRTLLVLGSSPEQQVRRMFRNSEQGAWYDPSDFSSMYQDSIGTTPVTAAEQLVGLVLDKRQALVRGGESVVNGSLSVDANWTKGSGWSITGGKAVRVADTTFTNFSQASILTSGKTYEITFDVDAIGGSGGLIVFAGGTTQSTVVTTTGAKRFILAAAGGTSLIFQATQATTTATIDNISAREIPGNHALQATAGSRPTIKAGGLINYSSGTKSLVTTWASSLGSACAVAHAIQQADASILASQTITTTYTDTTDNCGLVIINRDLSSTETNQLRRWLNRHAG